jgi:hypothetical protein
MLSPRYSGQILNKLAFSQQIFDTRSNIKLHENPVMWEPSHTMRTDGGTETTRLAVAFRHFANAPKHVRGEQLIHGLMLKPEYTYEAYRFTILNRRDLLQVITYPAAELFLSS